MSELTKKDKKIAEIAGITFFLVVVAVSVYAFYSIFEPVIVDVFEIITSEQTIQERMDNVPPDEMIYVYAVPDGYTIISHDFYEPNEFICSDPYGRYVECSHLITRQLEPRILGEGEANQ